MADPVIRFTYTRLFIKYFEKAIPYFALYAINLEKLASILQKYMSWTIMQEFLYFRVE